MNTLRYLLLGFVMLYGLMGVIIYFFQERFIFLPTVLEEDYAFEFDHPFEEHELESAARGSINVLHFKSVEKKGLIVYFHGNAGSLERWGKIVEPYVDLGYDVVIADYRGYGKSRGERNQKNLLKDAEVVYAFAKTLSAENRIILFGRSLGSGFASYLAGRNRPAKLILETPFYSLEEEANRRFMIYPVSWLLNYRLKSYHYLQSNEAPVYVFHGTEDQVVSYQSGQHLFNSIPTNGGRFFTIEGGKHNDLEEYVAFWEAMKALLDE